MCHLKNYIWIAHHLLFNIFFLYMDICLAKCFFNLIFIIWNGYLPILRRYFNLYIHLVKPAFKIGDLSQFLWGHPLQGQKQCDKDPWYSPCYQFLRSLYFPLPLFSVPRSSEVSYLFLLIAKQVSFSKSLQSFFFLNPSGREIKGYYSKPWDVPHNFLKTPGTLP